MTHLIIISKQDGRFVSGVCFQAIALSTTSRDNHSNGTISRL